MLELLIKILILMGININSADTINVPSSALDMVRANESFERLGGESALQSAVTETTCNGGIIITDMVDPVR